MLKYRPNTALESLVAWLMIDLQTQLQQLQEKALSGGFRGGNNLDIDVD